MPTSVIMCGIARKKGVTMGSEINRIIISGTLSGSIQLKRTKSTGTSVVNFGLDCEGKGYPCALFGPTAVEVAGWATPGCRVVVEGRLSKRSIPTIDGGSIADISIKAEKVVPMP